MGKGRTGRWLLKRNEEIEGVMDMKISGVSFGMVRCFFVLKLVEKVDKKT